MWTTIRSTARGRYYRRYAAQYWKDHWMILSLALLQMIGIWIGARFGAVGDGGAVSLSQLLESFLTQRTSQSIQTTLVLSSAEGLAWLALLFCCGFSIIAAPCILLIPVVKGMGYGLTAASLIITYGTAGLPVLILVLLPSAIVHSVVLLIGCRVALLQSLTLFRIVQGEGRGEENGGLFSRFCVQMGILALLTLIAAAGEGVLYSAFRAMILPLVG